jgi:hypothetical protein
MIFQVSLTLIKDNQQFHKVWRLNLVFNSVNSFVNKLFHRRYFKLVIFKSDDVNRVELKQGAVEDGAHEILINSPETQTTTINIGPIDHYQIRRAHPKN